MKLFIDSREPKTLIKYITSLNESSKNKIIIEQKQLDNGDFIFYDEINNKNILVIERKSLEDLESSIKDGRYNEQSFRLNELNIHNHNIIYLIEGAIINYKNTFFRNTLYSTLLSLNYYKGFSVITSLNKIETGDILLAFSSKLIRENKPGFYNDLSNNTDNNTINNTNNTINNTNNYINNIKLSKKSNVTCDNIFQLMIMQIPGISAVSAQAITNEFNNIQELIESLKNEDNKLENIKLASGRKINKTIYDSLKKYLLNI
tara:strand:- start:2 stop:784 length:783 start_codon:yes stop_codon:yes gene_type:complete